MATLTITPNPAQPGQTVDVTGASFNPKVKFALTTTDPNGVEVGQTTNINRPRRDGTFAVGINVPPIEGTAKVSAYQSNVRVASVDVVVQRSAPVPATGPSGIAMPTADLAGWRQVFADDFNNPIPEGQFPQSTGGRWAAYPWPWPNANGTGQYDPKCISIHDGVMDMRLYTDAQGIPHQANPSPIWVPQSSTYSGTNQLYGRYSACMKADPVDGYKTAWLLWPQSGAWPRDGEIDFPEGSLDGTIAAFMHRQNGTSGSDQDYYGTSARYTSWHVFTIEWLPTRCTFLLDGQVIGQSTARIPNTPMRWQLQTETELTSTKPPPSAAGHVLVDWVTVHAKA